MMTKRHRQFSVGTLENSKSDVVRTVLYAHNAAWNQIIYACLVNLKF